MRLNLNHTLLPALAVLFTALVATGGLFSLSGDSGNELTGDVTGYKIFAKPSAKPLPKLCAQKITYACEDRNPTNCRNLPNACLPAGWSKQSNLSSSNVELPEPQSNLTPKSSPTPFMEKDRPLPPNVLYPKPNLKKCLLKVLRPCLPRRTVDQYGCRPCSSRVVR